MIDHHGKYEYMGEGSFCWFFGIVEDISDPLEAGRVRVRCFGFHSPDKNMIPTEHLPWAVVMSSTTSASVSGVGSTPHSLVQGSQVIGFFQDGSNAQFPVIMGSVPSVPQTSPDPSKGFSDPDGVYPKEEFLGIPDVNMLAGSSHAESSYRISRTESIEERGEIESASGDMWTERDSEAAPEYPNNHVIETKSGHILEIDDTDGSERIHLRHKDGSYFEIHPDGSVSKRITGNEQSIVSGDENILIEGAVRINTENKADITIQNKVHVKVNEGDIQIEVLDGNANISVNGNADLNITGDMNTSVDGNKTINVKGDMTTNVDGNWTTKASGRSRLDGSRVDLN